MAKSRTIALIGSESLIGREVRDLVGSGDYPFDLRLVTAVEEEAGSLTAVGEEAALVGALKPGSLDGVAGMILAASPQVNAKAAEMAERGVFTIDLTFTAEESTEARLRAPLAEPPEFEAPESAVYVVAHPAAIALAMFLRRLQSRYPIRRSVTQVFVPASERGTAGLEELQQQTTNLFAFKSLPKGVFDAQSAFNMLARYGEEAADPLEDTELRIERHLATLLSIPGEGAGAPMPSLRAIQAPVFHGYSLSLWVELDGYPGTEALEDELAGPGIDIRGAGFDPPSNVGQAGQGGISVGSIAIDRNHAQACWFWVVADNLRLSAENALEVARQIV